jgi:hypothetical protein
MTGYWTATFIKNVNPGDCWTIKSDLEHSAEIIENSIAIEVFSPVRKDYLP